MLKDFLRQMIRIFFFRLQHWFPSRNRLVGGYVQRKILLVHQITSLETDSNHMHRWDSSDNSSRNFVLDYTVPRDKEGHSFEIERDDGEG